MSNLLTTILVAFILMILVTIALGISRLLTGKNRLKKRCGMRPKDEDCHICGAKKKKECDDDSDDDNTNYHD